MSDSQCQSRPKASKPFCSLAYLAKSTAAINGNSDIRIVSGGGGGGGGGGSRTPHVAATAKVPERASPTLPTGAAIAVNGHAAVKPTNGHDDTTFASSSAATSPTTTTTTIEHPAPPLTDIFGEINEEETTMGAHDQLDSGVDLRRPWELTNSYVRRVPPSLMTATQNGGLNGHGSGGLSSLSKLNSMDCWDYTIELECLKGPQDLQLAAELGKTLLERNKELETLLKEHKSTIDEQEQEIVYLKKHTTALREVNDSRLKVYEQLEVGIQDLERANHRLLVENTSDKKHIKTLVHSIESLETRCDELNKQLDETRHALSMERRKHERLLAEKRDSGANGVGARQKPQSPRLNGDDSDVTGYDASTSVPENCSFAFRSLGQGNNANSTGISGSSGSGSGSGSGVSGVSGGVCEASGNSLDLSMVCSGEDNEHIINLVNDLETTKKALVEQKQRCAELEHQILEIIQENQSLQSRVVQNSANEEMRSMHDELSILDEVRQGQMCSRCLRAVEDRATINDEQSSIAPTEECDDEEEEEEEERSLLDLDGSRDDNGSDRSQAAYRSSLSIKMSSRLPDSLDPNAPASPNPYRDLVEKYEALLEVQRSSVARKSSNNGMSLAEEFQSSGEFNQTQKLMLQAAAAVAADNCNASSNGDGDGDRDGASSCNGSTATTNDGHSQKAGSSNGGGGVGSVGGCSGDGGGGGASEVGKSGRGRTPTEFSEAETSSSGFSDETSNKCTQTDDRPGYFLCSIGDGDDCKFSIYDDVSPIDSRFRNRPEYRELFKEIFAVLKKAAENKEEGDKLPLLDDTHPNGGAAAGAAIAKVPPVTPANEEPPTDFGDDAQSIISSAVSEQSFAMSECITKMERKTAKKHIIEKSQENRPPSALATSIAQLASVAPAAKPIVENGRVLTPLKREPLEYLSVGVGIKKKSRRKNRNFSNDRAESPVALPSPPRFYVSSGKKRKDVRPFVQSPMAATPEQSVSASGSGNARASRAAAKFEWNGSSMVIYNRSANSPHHAALRGRELDLNSIEYRPSTVSQDLHKLKKLDLSYAEVLRRADACKQHHHKQHQQQQQQQQQQQRRRHPH